MSPSSAQRRQAGGRGRLCCAIFLALCVYVTGGAGDLDGLMLGLMFPEGPAVVDQTPDAMDRLGLPTLRISDPPCPTLPPLIQGISSIGLPLPPGRLAAMRYLRAGPSRPRAHLARQQAHPTPPSADPA